MTRGANVVEAAAALATLLADARRMFRDQETHDRLRAWWDRETTRALAVKEGAR